MGKGASCLTTQISQRGFCRQSFTRTFTMQFMIVFIVLFAVQHVAPNPIQPLQLSQFGRRLIQTEANSTTPPPETTPFVPVPTTDLCEELCKEGFGGSLCMCNIPPVHDIEVNEEEPETDDESNEADKESNEVNKEANEANKDSNGSKKEPSGSKTETTTEIDCEQMCEDGTGGSFCECPPPPIRISIPADVQSSPLKAKLNERDCAVLCEKGIGNHMCECKKGRRPADYRTGETITEEICSVLCHLPGYPTKKSRCQCHLFE